MQAFASVVLACILLPIHAAQSARLSRPFRPDVASIASDVQQFALTPSGDQALYNAWLSGSAFSNHLVPVAGGASVDVPGGADAKLVPGSGVVLFTVTESDPFNLYTSLYRASLADPDAATQIERIHGVSTLLFDVSPDGARVVYRAFQGSTLYSAPIDGSQPRVILYQGSTRVENAAISADSQHVVAWIGTGLVRFSIDASQAPAQLNGSHQVRGFELLPDATVLYLAQVGLVNPPIHLFSRPLDASSPPLRLSGSFVTGGKVERFRAAPDGSAVAFLADAFVDERFELFSIPLDGSTTPVPLSGAPLAAGDVQLDFQFDASSQRVLYRADAEVDERFELFSVPAAGGVAPVKLSATPVSGGGVTSFALPAAGSRAAYRADQDVDERFELYVVPTDASSPPLPLSGSLAVWADVQDDYRLDPAGTLAFFRLDQAADETFQLFGRDLDALAPPLELNGPLPPGGDVLTGFAPATGGRVVFRADEAADEVIELFSASLTSARVRLNAPLWPGPDPREVTGFAEARRPGRAVYRAEHARQGLFELFSVALDDARDFQRLNPPLDAEEDVDSFLLTPDERSVLFSTDGGLEDRLCAVPLAGGTPVRLNPPSAGYARLAFLSTADSLRAVYRADQDSPGRKELYSVPLDGSAAPLKLNGLLTSSESVDEFLASTTGRVVFTVHPAGLWSAPADASAPALALAPTLGRCRDLRLAPDGTRVIFLAAPTGRNELFSVPLDGSAPAVRLNGPLAGGGGVVAPTPQAEGFAISPDSARVVYRADQDTPYDVELYSAPLDGSTPAVRIVDLPPAANADVEQFEISADSTRVVYRADALVDFRLELFRVGIDGTLPAVKLSAPLVANGNVISFRTGAGSDVVVYQADQDADNRVELFAVPIDGGAVLKLNAPLLSAADDVDGFVLDRSGSWTAYSTTNPTDRVIHAVPVDGSAPARLVSGPMVAGGYASLGFVFSADSRRVFYLANQEELGARELFQGFAQRPPARRPGSP